MKKLYLNLFLLIFSTLSLHAQNIPIVLEAEDAALGADYAIEEGDITYIAPKTDYAGTGSPAIASKVVTFSVTFPAAGTYQLFARIYIGPNGANDDSFYAAYSFGEKDVNASNEWALLNGLGDAGYSTAKDYVVENGDAGAEEWVWINVSYLAGGTLYEVTELDQTFQIGAREDGLRIDKIAFANANLYYSVENLDNMEEGAASLPEPDYFGPVLATGHDKFLGSVWSASQKPFMTHYFNQITAENSAKWGSVEGVRDVYNWGDIDEMYQTAKDSGYLYKWHVMIWGSQQPAWLADLTAEEQLEEIHEWFDAVATRYPDLEMIEVVNEPLHVQPVYQDALGGGSFSTWEWVRRSFELARSYFPNAKLLINEYGIISNPSAASDYMDIVRMLQNDNLIDGVGIQSHGFNLNTSNDIQTPRQVLDMLSATGLPVYITELDVDGMKDHEQLRGYQKYMKLYWEHPAVKGVTLWGYRPGMWRTEQGAYLVNPDGSERPALQFLRKYLNGTYVPVARVRFESSSASVITDETEQINATVLPTNATFPELLWATEDASVATVNSTGIVSGVTEGTTFVSVESVEFNQANYKVKITVNNGITSADELAKADQLIFYPNPVSAGNLTIKGAASIEVLEVFDMNGKLMTRVNNAGNESIDVPLDLTSGMYLLHASDGEKHTTNKLIVK